MIMILEYAELSSHVYNVELLLFSKMKKVTDFDKNRIRHVSAMPEGWIRVIDVDPRMQTHNAFYAQLYIKIDRQVPRYFDEVNLKSEENCAPDETGSPAAPNRLAYDLVNAAML